MEHLLEVVLSIVILPSIYYWFKGFLDRKKRDREATEVHLQNAIALDLLTETMVGFRQDLGKTHYAVLELLKKVTDKEEEIALENKIKGMIGKQD